MNDNCSCNGITTGLNGYNSFTSLTAAFTIPAIGDTGTIFVKNQRPYTGLFANVGQNINVGGNTFKVTVAGAASITVENLESYGNEVEGTVLPVGTGVSPGGYVAPPVTFDGGIFVPSDLTSGLPGSTSTYQSFYSGTFDKLININDVIKVSFTGKANGTTLSAFRITLDSVTVAELTGITDEGITSEMYIKRTSTTTYSIQIGVKNFLNLPGAATGDFIFADASNAVANVALLPFAIQAKLTSALIASPLYFHCEYIPSID